MTASSASAAPRVAVVIPCHDDGELTAGAVASVREAEPVELVVVDDGSTDPATLAVLERLRAGGVAVVRRETAGGPGAARTAGLRHTAAPYLFPLDADDQLEPGALGALADLLERHPEAGAAWGDYALFGDYDGRYRAPGRFLPWSVTYVNQYPVCSLFRRAALERLGGWADRGYEDWGVWLGLVEHGLGGVHAPRVVYRRRLLHGGRAGLEDRRRHQALYAELQARHPAAFARRAELRRQERPPRWKRVVYPVLFGSRSVVPYPVEAFLQRTMLRFGLRLSR
jgi:Glycosyl transferase family 2